MSKIVYGKLNLSWGPNVLLPLEEAHKVQAILAKHARGYSEGYRAAAANISYLEDYKVPAVDVVGEPQHDCTGLSHQQKSDWLEMIRESIEPQVMDPVMFTKIRGENNE